MQKLRPKEVIQLAQEFMAQSDCKVGQVQVHTSRHNILSARSYPTLHLPMWSKDSWGSTLIGHTQQGVVWTQQGECCLTGAQLPTLGQDTCLEAGSHMPRGCTQNLPAWHLPPTPNHSTSPGAPLRCLQRPVKHCHACPRRCSLLLLGVNFQELCRRQTFCLHQFTSLISLSHHLCLCHCLLLFP